MPGSGPPPKCGIFHNFFFLTGSLKYLPAGRLSRRGDPEHAVHAELGGDLLWVDAAREGEPLLELLGHVGLARGGLALLLGRHDQHLALGLDVEILTSVNESYEISVNITV